MQSGVVEQARQAAAAARTSERAAREAAALPPEQRPRYRGVQKRGGKYVATVWNGAARRAVWLGSYATSEEAAYAYDAGARCLLGRWARPNFPVPTAAPAPLAAAAGAAGEALASAARDGDVAAAAGVIAGLAQARRAAAHQEPAAADDFHGSVPAPPPAAGGQHHHQPAGQAAAFPYQRAVVPPFLQFFYRSASVAPVLNRPVSSALSSTEPVVESCSAAAAPTRREVATAAAIEPGQSVVGDNFTADGASSSVAPMPGEAQ